MKISIALLKCFFILSAGIATAQEKIDTAMMRKIRNEEMTHSQVPQIAHQLTDVSGPRLTNSPGYKRAAAWAVNTLKTWGLTNAATESFGEYGKGWETEKSYAAMKAPYYYQLHAYPLAYSPSTQGQITASAVVINAKDTTAVQKNKSRLLNKIVILAEGDSLLQGSPFKAYAQRLPDSTLANLGESYMFSKEMLGYIIRYFKMRKKLMAELHDAGALAVIHKGPGRDGTTFVDGLYDFKKGIQPGLPELVLMPEDYLRIVRMLKSGSPVELDLDVKTKFYTDDLNGYNVVGEIAGTDPALKSEVVMLGGHLDSWHSGTGATDNAAGCIVMMEAVRILKALNVKPRRTIRIALWGGEEEGLLGSIGYVRKHFGDPVTMQLKPEQSKISVYFNLDNGTGKIRGVYLQNNEAVRPVFQSWLEPFHDLGAKTLTSSNTGGTDHLSFDAVGIPGFQFIQDPIEYETKTHHSNMDTYDHLLIDDLKQASLIVAAFVYNAAVRNDKIQRKPLPKAGEWLFDIDLGGN